VSPRGIVLGLALLLAGCGGVVSESPASEGEQTRGDERLLGFWRVDESATKTAPDARVDETVVLVGREAPGSNELRLMSMTRRPDDTIGTMSIDVRATTIAAKDYASVRLAGETETWGFVRYSLDDPDTLRVVGFDERAVAADVRAGAVAGTAPSEKDSADPHATVLVRLKVTTPALRAYLEKRGDAVARADRPLVLRRLRPR